MTNFFIGVGGSLVAAFLIFLARYQLGSLLNFVFSNYYPKVSGKYLWVDIPEPGDAHDAYPDEKTYLYLKQAVNSIKGYGKVFSGEEFMAEYSIRGKLSVTRILTIACESATTEHHDVGAGVFKLHSDGKSFTGIYVTLCATCQNTTSCHVKLERLSRRI